MVAGLKATDANVIPLTPVSFLSFAVRTYPDQIAWTYDSRKVSYVDFEMRCRKLASLLKSHSVGVGDVVSVIAPNVPAVLELHYAVPMIGAVLNAINIRQDVGHVVHVLSEAAPSVLFADIEFLDHAKAAMARSGHACPVIVIDDSTSGYAEYAEDNEYEKLLNNSDIFEYEYLPTSELDPIALNYTSGTSGKPKGVLHSHRAAYLNAIGISLLWNLPVWPSFLWIVPLFHCNGWCLSWAITLRAGTHVLKRRVIPSEIFEALSKNQVTHFCCAPTVLDMLLSEENGHGRADGLPVEIATGGSAPSSARIQRMRELGFRITHLYGLTETLSNSVYCAPQSDWASLDADDMAMALSKQGVAQPMVEEVAVLDSETGERMPRDGDSVGEICIRSNTVMTGYIGDHQKSSDIFFNDWLRTGDLGVCHPDGYIEIRDRLKDIIISGGENVSSLEVEEILARHQAVAEVAVVGMPDPKWDEVPCAFVRLKKGNGAVDEQELIDWCRSVLPGFKSPKRIVFITEFPHSATGKVQKNQLRENLQPTE